MHPASHSGFGPNPGAKTSQCAIWSLVCGILSFCLSIFGGIPAIVLGILGIIKVNADPANLKGKGLAISGIILGVVGVFASFFVAIMASVSIPAYVGVQERGQAVKDMADIRIISVAIQVYASENEGRYPDSLDQLVPDYLDDASHLNAGSGREEGPVQFLYRSALTESSPADEPILLSPIKYQGTGTPVAYVRGNASTVRGVELERIRALFLNPERE